MNIRLSKLLEKLTPAEQSEVATFAAFLLARRRIQVATDDISIEEVLQLMVESGSLDWLDVPEEDVYSPEDGRPVKRHSIVELRGLGKDVWKDIDAQDYIDQERRSWHR